MGTEELTESPPFTVVWTGGLRVSYAVALRGLGGFNDVAFSLATVTLYLVGLNGFLRGGEELRAGSTSCRGGTISSSTTTATHPGVGGLGSAHNGAESKSSAF